MSFLIWPNPWQGGSDTVPGKSKGKGSMSLSGSMDSYQVVYVKENVSVYPTQHARERISGRLRLIKQDPSLFMVQGTLDHILTSFWQGTQELLDSTVHLYNSFKECSAASQCNEMGDFGSLFCLFEWLSEWVLHIVLSCISGKSRFSSHIVDFKLFWPQFI